MRMSSTISQLHLQITTAKTELPVKYLYRPEEQQIRLMMDMRTSRFLIDITYGKDSTEKTL